MHGVGISTQQIYITSLFQSASVIELIWIFSAFILLKKALYVSYENASLN